MSTCLAFPGHGGAIAEAAYEWSRHSAHARRLLQQAAHETGVPVTHMTHASGIALRDTAVFQPCMTAICVAAWLDLDSRLSPALVVGHSLGEIAACVAAGAMPVEAAVPLAALRGRLMSRAASESGGAMVAIEADSEDDAQRAVSEARRAGQIVIAAHNAPDQWVLSGATAALRAVASRFRPRLVATGGPWHSSALAPYEEEFRGALDRAVEREPRVPLLCNRTGDVVTGRSELVTALAEQFTHRVEWVRCMGTVEQCGIARVITVGPSRTLRSLIRRNLPELPLFGIESPADLSQVNEGAAA